MSLSEVKWNIPHGGQNCVKNTTLYIQGQCLFLTHQPFKVSCLLPPFGRLSKSVLTKCDNCLEVRWTIPHLLRQKEDYHYVKVGLQQLRLWQTTFSFRGKVGFPIFQVFVFVLFVCLFVVVVVVVVFCLVTILIHIHMYSHVKEKLHGVKYLSGTFAFYWNF